MKSIEFTTDDPNDAPTWTEVEDFLNENLIAGDDEAQTTTYGDGVEGQDGVITNGSFLAIGDALPTADQRYWFRFTHENGKEQVTGGDRGCRVVLAETGLQPIDGGPNYTEVRFGVSGYAPGDTKTIT